MLASTGADPFGLPATDEPPFQSPTLPSRPTFAAHTRPDVATRSTQRTSNPLPGNFLRYHATVANSSRPSGTTSQPDNGMACAAADGGGALLCKTIVNAAVVSCPPVALVLATSTFSVPPAGSDDNGMKVSIAAVPCEPLPRPTGHPAMANVLDGPRTPAAQSWRSIRLTVALDGDVVTTVVHTCSIPLLSPAPVATPQPVAI